MGGGYGIFFLSCQNLPFLRIFLKASKMIFYQKNEGFLSSYFTTDEEIFVVLNPSEKQCFLILSSFSHNLTRKLIFFSKRVSKASNLICLLLFMLPNVVFDAFKLHFWCFTTRSKHPKWWNSTMSWSEKLCCQIFVWEWGGVQGS